MPDAVRPGSEDTPARRAICAMIIAVVGAIAYANSFRGSFIFDDYASIHHNPLVHDLRTAWQTPDDATYTVAGRPVLSLTLGANYAAGGLEPAGYHAVNLAIHLLNAILLFGLARRLLAAGRHPLLSPSHALGAAFAIALLWCVHPLQTSSVTYVIQRAESLMASFFLLATYAAVRGFAAERATPWFVLSVAACWIGAGAKEVIAVVPLIILAADRVFHSAGWTAALRARPAFYLALAVVWPISAVLIFTSARAGTSIDPLTPMTSLEYLRTQAGVLLHYLRLSAWPEPLVLHYGWPAARSIGEWIIPGVIVIALLAASAVWLRRGRALGFAGLWFFAILAPTSSVIAIPREVAAEHRMYLPLAAIIAVLVTAFARFALARRVNALIPSVIVLILAAAGAFLTWRRNAHFESEAGMWRRVVAERPMNAIAWSNLGVTLARTGDRDGAIDAFQRATALRPNHPDFKANLGGALVEAKRYDEAIEALNDAAERSPATFATNFNLALALVEGRRAFAKARPFAERAVSLVPTDPRATDLTSRILMAVGDTRALLALLEKASTANPKRIDLAVRLAATHARFGDPTRALAIAEPMHRTHPGNREVTLLIAWLRAAHASPTVRDPAAAIAAVDRTSTHLRGKTPDLEAARAAALAALGRFDDAIAVAEPAARQSQKAGDVPLATAIRRDIAGYRERRPARIPWE